MICDMQSNEPQRSPSKQSLYRESGTSVFCLLTRSKSFRLSEAMVPSEWRLVDKGQDSSAPAGLESRGHVDLTCYSALNALDTISAQVYLFLNG